MGWAGLVLLVGDRRVGGDLQPAANCLEARAEQQRLDWLRPSTSGSSCLAPVGRLPAQSGMAGIRGAWIFPLPAGHQTTNKRRESSALLAVSTNSGHLIAHRYLLSKILQTQPRDTGCRKGRNPPTNSRPPLTWPAVASCHRQAAVLQMRAPGRASTHPLSGFWLRAWRDLASPKGSDMGVFLGCGFCCGPRCLVLVGSPWARPTSF